MAQRQYPHDYSDRPERIPEREREWQQGRNAEYQARGWAPDTDRDSALGEYYPTDHYNPDEDAFFDESEFTGARQPRSLADNRQTGYGYHYGERSRGYGEEGRGYREERGDSMGGYGVAYKEAASRRRAAMLDAQGSDESDYFEGSAQRQGFRQAHRRHSGRNDHRHGHVAQGYGPGYGDYNPDYQSLGGGQSRGEGGYSAGYGAQGEAGARGYQERASGQPNYRGRGPKNYQRLDARIHEEICERLSDDAAVDASEIDVRVKDGVVHLEGSVESRRMKHRAEDIVADCSGVKDIENRLTIARAQAEGTSTEQRNQ